MRGRNRETGRKDKMGWRGNSKSMRNEEGDDVSADTDRQYGRYKLFEEGGLWEIRRKKDLGDL